MENTEQELLKILKSINRCNALINQRKSAVAYLKGGLMKQFLREIGLITPSRMEMVAISDIEELQKDIHLLKANYAFILTQRKFR